MSTLKTVVVQCREERYAIDIEHVMSIELLGKVNPIPHLPAYLLGLMKSRGELLPTLDLEQILYNTASPLNEKSRVIVLQLAHMFIGLLVDDATEVMDIPTESLTSQALSAYSTTPYFTSVANLEDVMITLIDPTVLSQTVTGMDDIADYVKAQLAEE